MKYITVLIASLLVSGCVSIPIKPEFPKPYTVGAEKKLAKCPELEEQQGDNVPITELLKTVVNNYVLYYKCSDHVDGWNTWYKEQKENYDKK